MQFLPSNLSTGFGISSPLRILGPLGAHLLRFAPMGGASSLVTAMQTAKRAELINYSESQAVKNEEAIEDTPFEESDKN